MSPRDHRRGTAATRSIPQVEYWDDARILKFTYEMIRSPGAREKGPRLHRNGYLAYYGSGRQREGSYRYVPEPDAANASGLDLLRADGPSPAARIVAGIRSGPGPTSGRPL